MRFRAAAEAFTLSRDVGLVKNVSGFLGGRSRQPSYSNGTLEKTIYDNRHLNTSRLFMVEDVVSVDDDQVVPKYLWRCFVDRCAFVHGNVFCLSALLSSYTTPFTFMWDGSWSDPGPLPLGDALIYIDIGLDVVYGLCLLAWLNISFMHRGRRVEVVSRRKIIEKHCYNPFYWVRWLTATCYIWLALFDGKLALNNMKVFRILDFVFPVDALWRLRDQRHVRLLRPILLLLWCSHWVACLLASVGGYGDRFWELGVEPFTTRFKGATVSGHISLYLMAFVEALYMLTGSLDNPLGEGDGPRNRNFGSLLIVSVFGPIGCIVAAMMVASVVREYTMRYALDMRHEENKEFIKRALQNLNIPKDLQRRVFNLRHYQRMSHDHEAFCELFKKKHLSPPLESALRVYLYTDSVLGSQYFKGKDHNYILEVVRVLEDQIYLPGDFVIRRGEVDSKMFFVAKGELTILVPDPRLEQSCDVDCTMEVGHKYRGDFFGEIALIKDCMRTAWVRSDTYALLSTLERAQIEAIWKHYPEEKEDLMRVVSQVAILDRKRQAQQLARSHYSKSESDIMARVSNTKQTRGIPEDARAANERDARERAARGEAWERLPIASRSSQQAAAMRSSKLASQMRNSRSTPELESYMERGRRVSPAARRVSQALHEAAAGEATPFSATAAAAADAAERGLDSLGLLSDLPFRFSSEDVLTLDRAGASRSEDGLGKAGFSRGLSAGDGCSPASNMQSMQDRLDEIAQRQAELASMPARVEEMLMRQAALERLVLHVLDATLRAAGGEGLDLKGLAAALEATAAGAEASRAAAGARGFDPATATRDRTRKKVKRKVPSSGARGPEATMSAALGIRLTDLAALDELVVQQASLPPSPQSGGRAAKPSNGGARSAPAVAAQRSRQMLPGTRDTSDSDSTLCDEPPEAFPDVGADPQGAESQGAPSPPESPPRGRGARRRSPRPAAACDDAAAEANEVSRNRSTTALLPKEAIAPIATDLTSSGEGPDSSRAPLLL